MALGPEGRERRPFPTERTAPTASLVRRRNRPPGTSPGTRAGRGGDDPMPPDDDAGSSRRLERSPPLAEPPSTPAQPDSAEPRPAGAASDRDVEVWRLDCARHRDAGRVFDAALDAPEHARLRGMRRADARLRFSAGRWLVRHVLARRLDCTESEVELTVGTHGRPSLATGGIDFNLSHAGAVVVLALSTARVGVDIESTSRATDWRAIARRFFSAVELAAIEACDETGRRTAFFRAWARKEAFVKALGTGFATGFDRFDVSTGPRPALLGARIDGIDAREWSIRDFASGPGYLGAVAVRAARVRVRVHDAEP